MAEFDYASGQQRFGPFTYSQHGDDIILCAIFDRLNIVKPSFMDIGAFHPMLINNTFLLYERGSRGINVDANPKLIRAFEDVRPKDLTLCCAVGAVRASKQTFYVADNPGWSSLVQRKPEWTVEQITVDVWTISDIVIGKRNGVWPQLLSIDIEGGDVEALEASLPSEGDRPVVVIAEAMVWGVIDFTADLRQLMTARGYFLHSWAGANTIWVRNEERAALLG
jgi:FkbM family methyltransferase